MNRNVFIIEPENIVGVDLKKKLQQEGCKAINISNISGARSVMEKTMPELVIVDSCQLNNSEYYAEVESLCGLHAVPMITIGENTDSSERIKVIGHFSKPFVSDEVSDLAAQYFEKEEQRMILQRQLLNNKDSE